MKENEESTMKRFMRPYIIRVGIALLGTAITIAPAVTGAQTSRIRQFIEDANPLLHSTTPGYLGVLVGDIDNDTANKLKLKDARGAVVTLIDHDAPAAQVGLRVNDVVLEVNGQTVETAESFGRMMHEIPPGRKITLVVSRDGASQTMTVQLVDRKKLDTDVWNKLNSGSDASSPVNGLAILGNGAGGDAPLPGGFHMPFVGSSTLKVGAVVEPLTSQMADYLGVENGLMVKQVARKTEASAAGMKAFDVILKVGADNISTVSDWDRAMRSNQGKSVAVTILRDKKQQTITLQVDSKRRSALEFHHVFLPDGPGPMMAFAEPDGMQGLMDHLQIDESAMASMRAQAESLRDQLQQSMGNNHFGFTEEEADQLRKEAEQFRDAFKDGQFSFDQKQKDELSKEMQEFQKQEFQQDFKPFRFDQKQMDELKEQMQEFGKGFSEPTFRFDPNGWLLTQPLIQFPSFDEQQRKQMKEQMDQLKRQMEEMDALGFDHLV
jgi:hypothetical protein